MEEDLEDDLTGYTHRENDIFYTIPLEKRVDSLYFDIGNNSLEECLVDYNMLKKCIENIAIFSDISKSESEEVSINIANMLSETTLYNPESNGDRVEDLIDGVLASL
ncbi:hypothetical protein [Piscirickettsia litoralis]|uniref:hypothetical protein n=1 Tax=Piscirickettsia litoralis TaxID=1891921 RepID=UPI0029390DA5|nr:hypothetical protein [Piscirickettsia litoralis]